MSGGGLGAAQLAALIARADILVQNLKPGAMARMGLPIEDLRARPLKDRKAYDLLLRMRFSRRSKNE